MALHNFTGTVNLVGLNGRAFHGAYNAQAGQGVVFFSPTSRQSLDPSFRRRLMERPLGLYVEHLNIQAFTGAINVSGISHI